MYYYIQYNTIRQMLNLSRTPGQNLESFTSTKQQPSNRIPTSRHKTPEFLKWTPIIYSQETRNHKPEPDTLKTQSSTILITSTHLNHPLR